MVLFILFIVLNKISTFLFNTDEILNIFRIFAPGLINATEEK